MARKIVKKATAKSKAKKTAKKPAKKAVKIVKKKPVKNIKKVKKVAKKVEKKTIAVKKVTALKKAFTKTQLYSFIANDVGITKKQVATVFETLTNIVERHIKKGSVGSIKIEGLIKIEKVRKPAKKARKGINPFTGKPMTFKAKPAHSAIKVRGLKKLREMVS